MGGQSSYIYEGLSGPHYFYINITTNAPPTANFTWTPSTPTSHEMVSFNSTSMDSDGSIVNWTWELGDGATLYGEQVTHTYASDGTYAVNLTVTDDDGATNTTSRMVTVVNAPPTANFTWTPFIATTENPVQFTDTSTDHDGSIASWTWNFGDGGTSHIQHPTHQYTQPGTYNVTLTVVDDDGSSHTTTKQLTVAAIDETLITFSTNNEIPSTHISTDITFTACASAFNHTYGFLARVDATWTLDNMGTNASIDATQGECVTFTSGWQDGDAVLAISDGPRQDNVTFTVNGSYHTFFLCSGWNYITVPVSHNYTAKTLGQNISGCIIVARWNATASSFQSFLVGTSPPSMDFPIEDGVGYYLYVSNHTLFSVHGGPLSNVAVQLQVGWDSIGWFNDTATTASSLGTAIQDCTVVATWDASAGLYRTFLVGISPPSADFAIEKGTGVSIYVTSPSTWHGEG